MLLSDWLYIRDPMIPSLGSILCPNSSRDSGKHFCLSVYYVIKDVLNADPEEQLEEET